MAGQRELGFEGDKPADYVTPVLKLVNEGRYTEARKMLDEIQDNQTAAAVRRSISVRTNIYL